MSLSFKDNYVSIPYPSIPYPSIPRNEHDPEPRTREQYTLVVCVYACATVEKYRDQIRSIRKTWGKLCNMRTNQENISPQVNAIVCGKVKLLFFMGEEKTTDEFAGDEFVYLPGVKNDYLSASYKQYLGLKHVYENYGFDFVVCCGTDTYLNIPKLVNHLGVYSPKEASYIGGHGCVRTLYNVDYKYHSGGPGFVLSYECMKQLYPFLSGKLVTDWLRICYTNNKNDLYGACDVSISYYLQTLNIRPRVITFDGLQFTHCNYMGFPCHVGETDITELMSCHLMSAIDFELYTEILLMNDFYV